jgi:predicted DNA-binding transcriptional regulator YafY
MERMKDDVYPRALEVHNWLKMGRSVTSKTVAEHYDISKRHAQRVMEFLQDRLKAPVLFDHRRKTYYYLDTTFELPALIMTEGEAVAMIVAHEALLRRLATPLSQSLLRALDGLKELLPKSVSVEAGDLLAQTSFVAMPARPVESRVLDAVTVALQKRQRVRIEYYSANGDEVTEREVDIFHLTHRWTDWYMVGYCHLRQALRTFALSRIKRIDQRSPTYDIPESFSADEYFRGAMGIETAEPQRVRLWFDAFEARWIRERTWHPTQRIIEQTDGAIIVELLVGLSTELGQWILSYGPHVRVLEPLKLATEIQKAHAAAAQSFKKPLAERELMRGPSRVDGHGLQA